MVYEFCISLRIKEGILERKQEIGSMKMDNEHKIVRDLKDCKHRDSLDTIRTDSPDKDSNKTVNL